MGFRHAIKCVDHDSIVYGKATSTSDDGVQGTQEARGTRKLVAAGTMERHQPRCLFRKVGAKAVEKPHLRAQPAIDTYKRVVTLQIMIIIITSNLSIFENGPDVENSLSYP